MLNRSERSFADEIAEFVAFVDPGWAGPVRVRYDYASGMDWSFPNAPAVDAAAFEAILRSSARDSVDLSVVGTDDGTLVVAPGPTSTLVGRDAGGAILGEATFGGNELDDARLGGSPADR